MMRFFLVVRPYTAHGLIVLGCVLAIGGLTVWLNPSDLDSGLGLILFVQMFLSASGFRVQAGRGYFDPVLLYGRSRLRAVSAHWWSSVMPGAAAWAVLAGFGYSLGSPAAWSALAGQRLLALFLVSAIAWAVGFALPRGVGGALWLGVLMALLLRHPELLASPSSGSAVDTLRLAATLALCPFLLIAPRAVAGPGALWTAGCLASALLLFVWRQGCHLDVALVDRS